MYLPRGVKLPGTEIVAEENAGIGTAATQGAIIDTLKQRGYLELKATGRGKKAVLSWRDISDEANLVILAPTKQGTLKLAAAMKGLDSRAQWVQDVDRIEIVRP